MKLDMNDIVNVLVALLIFEVAKRVFLNKVLDKLPGGDDAGE